MTRTKLGVNNLIWVQTGFLGDIILTTAAFRWVKEHIPHVEQRLITTPLGAKALSGHPDLKEILVFDKRGRSLWKAARDLRHQLRELPSRETVTLQAHRSARSTILCASLGFDVCTYEETSLSFLARWRVPRITLLHESLRILQLLTPLGIARDEFKDARPYLAPLEGTGLGRELDQWVGSHPLLALAPGSVWGTKRWPKEYYADLARRLLSESDAKLVILGTKDEAEAAEHVASVGDEFPGRLKNLAGQTSLDDLRVIYPRLRLLLCNDSSPLHYASAFAVPTLAIFGATVPALGFGPLAPGSEVLGLDLACRPCSDHGPQRCPLIHFNCMRQLLPGPVGDRVLERLGRLAQG